VAYFGAQWGVRSYCELSWELEVVLAVFDCRKTSFVLGAASVVARSVVVGLGRKIPPHQVEHPARAHDHAYEASPPVAHKSLIGGSASHDTITYILYVFLV
jgi:hypothetical protein